MEKHIIPLLADAPPTNGYTVRNADLMSCLLTSRLFCSATITHLYRRIAILRSDAFSKVLSNISQYPELGTLVRTLDLSHFTYVGLGRARRTNSEIQNLTAQTLLKCLELTPRLREFLVQEHLDDDISEGVVRKVFCDLPIIEGVDFCGSQSASFRQAFAAVLSHQNTSLPSKFAIKRLSLHECNTLDESVFEVLLSRLPNLTHLDVCRTQITESALISIPATARLTHLNLSKCTRLTGTVVVNFLITHPAVKDTLVYLNLLSDVSRHCILGQHDVEKLLPRLPTTLRALNMSGAKITEEHVSLLLPLTKHLEELSVGYSELSVDSINSLFTPPKPSTKAADGDGCSLEEQWEWVPPALRYLDVTGVSSITPSNLLNKSCTLLLPASHPLEVLEMGEKFTQTLRERDPTNRRIGWAVKELGRRSWYVRQSAADQPGPGSSDGKQGWKMGALWWGLRKVPVAWGEVGGLCGLYAYYMFKK
ncbi:hypothetical protein FGG08_006814 [Glutinoglossum americanum]|uniref:Uncharacterized protein n=1 Tax=Glutinoglossum americanum TaxID=1670608 RepID=A0A9P8I0I4_9PEZI|nr:hypothetical protein FGG08_006814 [Glutinoglossum americanum]